MTEATPAVSAPPSPFGEPVAAVLDQPVGDGKVHQRALDVLLAVLVGPVGFADISLRLNAARSGAKPDGGEDDLLAARGAVGEQREHRGGGALDRGVELGAAGRGT
jgi:hypothetical protein